MRINWEKLTVIMGSIIGSDSDVNIWRMRGCLRESKLFEYLFRSPVRLISSDSSLGFIEQTKQNLKITDLTYEKWYEIWKLFIF